MQETSLRVMNMVRRTLLETPEVTDRALYAAAVALEPSIGALSLKQFQARYPRRVRRLEIGPPTRRSREPRASPDEVPIADRPDLYAPGQDTLVQASSGQQRSREDIPVSGDATLPGSRARRVRRSVQGPGNPAGGSAADEGTGESGEIEAGSARNPAATPTGFEPSAASTSPPEPPQPWPLRLNPEAAARPAAPHLRLLRVEDDTTGATKRRRVQRGVGSVSRRSSRDRPSTPIEAEPRQEGAAEASPPLQHQESSPTHDTLAWTRDRLRRVLLDWAREIAEAETRGQLVGVLVRAHEYADRITRIAGMNDVSNRVIGGTDTTEGRATPGFEQIQERPELPRRRRIEEYDPAELDALVRWVTQTEPELELDDLVARVCTELGFKRRGRRIVAGIRGAVERVVSAR